MTGALVAGGAAEMIAAGLLLGWHYAGPHGWARRALARRAGQPDPGPTAHERWERSWSFRDRVLLTAALFSGTAFLAALWGIAPLAAFCVTAAAEVATAFLTFRAGRRHRAASKG